MEQAGMTLEPEEYADLEGLERLIGKGLLDADFRAYLLKDPANAAAEAGVQLNDYQLARLKGLSPDAVEVIAAGFARGVGMTMQGATRLW